MTQNAYHQSLRPTGNLGIQTSMATLEHAHIPLHWHNELEILFCLNGNPTIQIGNDTLTLSPRKLIVFDSQVEHAIDSRNIYMFLCIHVDKKRLNGYISDIDLHKIDCRPISQYHAQYQYYEHLCSLAYHLTRINLDDFCTKSMETDGAVLLMLSHLFRFFSVNILPDVHAQSTNNFIHESIAFINENYMHPITLDMLSSKANISKEHFCRIFKKHIGKTFLQYLTEVRISHSSYLLTTTDLPISRIMEQCGFTTQTLFNRAFKEIYQCTPREARKMGSVAVPMLFLKQSMIH